MKRALMGIVWFIVFFVILYIIYSVIVGVVIAQGDGATVPTNYHEGLQAGMAFARTHATALAVWRVVILVVAIVLAVAGSVKGWLPGTRKKPAASA
ncbi:MAG: hypothetical protein KGL98_05795 [Gammaproteobacteria bacterium]|nr:hypothetical protein [Gammaproteobacteria bacterium]MDE2460743.1 hypothetical protein [Gammaproteobacteria bacterium]